MFSENWDFTLLNQQSHQIVQNLRQEGAADMLLCPNGLALPASSNIHHARQVIVVCSGYPEHAGVWSYTLLEKSHTDSAYFEKTTMAPYFQDLAKTDIALVFLNPNAPVLPTSPEEALLVYATQLEAVYAALLSQSKEMKIVLLGFSLGGDAMLRFLQDHPEQAHRTQGLILIDPSPPHLGRRKLNSDVVALLDRAVFYGKGTADGRPDEFAEATKMRLKLTPILIPCDYHGEMPNLVWPQLFQTLPSLFV